jgi:hypothetical protein
MDALSVESLRRRRVSDEITMVSLNNESNFLIRVGL